MYVKIYDKALALARAPTELNYGQIILISYIYALNDNGNICYVTNKTLSDLLNTSDRTIKRWLQEMKEKKLIDVYYEEVNGREQRIISPKINLE